MSALVLRTSGNIYTVLLDNGQTAECPLKGNFRLRGIRSTNPVAVGDRVRVEDGYVAEILDRRNYIVRKSVNLSKQSHIIAANVDMAVLVVTMAQPQTSTTFIDRFLASAEAYRVPVVLALNKTDLLDADGLRLQELMAGLYESIGYRCVAVSAATGEGLDELRGLLRGVALLSGNSGVGKSTIINRLLPEAAQRTAELSDAHGTGMHTTTCSQMLPVPGGGWLIDTPGIKGFGTFDMAPEELTSYFPDIFRFAGKCRFSDCTHTHEPGCAVLKAVEDHYIAQSRYASYLSMRDDMGEGKYRGS